MLSSQVDFWRGLNTIIVQFRNGQIYKVFLLVIATGRSLLHCSMDDVSKVNKTRIKVLSSHPSENVEVRCPSGKKSISVIKNIALMVLRKRFINK